MTIIGIDPGPTESAIAIYDQKTHRIRGASIQDNEALVREIPNIPADILVVEWVSNYGMVAGADLFMTALWCGRFIESWDGGEMLLLTRPEIKRRLCGNRNAKGPELRQQIMALFGGEEAAIGNKKCPQCKGKGWFGAGRQSS